MKIEWCSRAVFIASRVRSRVLVGHSVFRQPVRERQRHDCRVKCSSAGYIDRRQALDHARPFGSETRRNERHGGELESARVINNLQHELAARSAHADWVCNSARATSAARSTAIATPVFDTVRPRYAARADAHVRCRLARLDVELTGCERERPVLGCRHRHDDRRRTCGFLSATTSRVSATMTSRPAATWRRARTSSSA